MELPTRIEWEVYDDEAPRKIKSKSNQMFLWWKQLIDRNHTIGWTQKNTI